MEPTTLDGVTVTLQTEAAGDVGPVDEAMLAEAVAALGGGNSFLIVERDDRPDAYAQTAIDRQGWIVEHREGAKQHWQAKASGAEEVTAVLTGWAFDKPGWRELVTWKVLDLGF